MNDAWLTTMVTDIWNNLKTWINTLLGDFQQSNGKYPRIILVLVGVFIFSKFLKINIKR